MVVLFRLHNPVQEASADICCAVLAGPAPAPHLAKAPQLPHGEFAPCAPEEWAASPEAAVLPRHGMGLWPWLSRQPLSLRTGTHFSSWWPVPEGSNRVSPALQGAPAVSLLGLPALPSVWG